MNSLFFTSYLSLLKQNKNDGKDLVLRSVHLNENAEYIYKLKTIKYDIRIESSDRYGVDIDLTLHKERGCRIHVGIHKKRGNNIYVSMYKNNEDNKFTHLIEDKLYERFLNYDDHALFYTSLLLEFPPELYSYIFDKKMSKKWNTISQLCISLIKTKCKNVSFKCNIETTNKLQSLSYT